MASAAEKRTMASLGIGNKSSESVKVVVRVRPLSGDETRKGHENVTEVDAESASVHLYNPAAQGSEPPKGFTFDATFDGKSTQQGIYDSAAAPIIDCALQGYNGTIFAYGQTGAGKSFTMEGEREPPELRGIIPNSFKHIFDEINAADDREQQFLVRVSYLEIYNEEIRDLLGRDPTARLDLRESVESGVYVEDLTSVVVKGVSEIDHVLKAGKKNRAVATTNMNLHSSRSHSMFMIVLESSDVGPDGKQRIRVGKLNLVDLAGSERQSKTGATGDRLQEAIKINQSLSALGNVISALVDAKSTHIPYRDSKLTRLLQDSLGGNTKTVMIANCGPADYNYDETLSTLRYANRAKNIKNKPKVNEDPKDAMLRQFQEEIVKLRQQLQQRGGGGGASGAAGSAGRSSRDSDVVEKVVEKVVVKKEGVSEDELKEAEERRRKQRERMHQLAAEEAAELLRARERSEAEAKQLAEEVRKRQEARQKEADEEEELKAKLKEMEAKVLQGGQIMSKAAKQEAELRRARMEMEERKRQEALLQQELSQRQEANLQLNEQFASLREEAEVKKKKLKKLWTRFQEARSEVSDLQDEFEKEKADLLDTIRELSRDLKLKDALIGAFVRPDRSADIERRARWNENTEEWEVAGQHPFRGHPLRPRRPWGEAEGSRFPVTAYAMERAAYDSSPRYRVENVVSLDLEMPDRTTQDYDGVDMETRVEEALKAALQSDEDEEEVVVAGPDILPDAVPRSGMPSIGK